MSTEEVIEYLKWIRPKKPYTQDKINVQMAIDIAIQTIQDRDKKEKGGE